MTENLYRGTSPFLEHLERIGLQKVSLEQLTDQDHIDLAYWRGVDEIAVAEGVVVGQLGRVVRDRMQHITDTLVAFPYTDVRSDIQFLYNCYMGIQESGETGDLAKGLSTYNHFKEAFVSDPQAFAGIERGFLSELSVVYQLNNPLERIVVPPLADGSGKRRAHTKPRITRRRHEAAAASWVMLGTRENGSTVYITDTVLEELKENERNHEGYFSEYDHATTSAALPGLARHRELLSRTRLQEKGDVAVSGERADRDPRVFVSDNFMYGTQHSQISWFNEFPIDIEIDRSTPREHAPEWGISLGHEVPLARIVRMYCPSRNRSEVQSWVQSANPATVVHSYEAYFSSADDRSVIGGNRGRNNFDSWGDI